MSLKKSLMKIALQNPELAPNVRKILATFSGYADAVEVAEAMGWDPLRLDMLRSLGVYVVGENKPYVSINIPDAEALVENIFAKATRGDVHILNLVIDLQATNSKLERLLEQARELYAESQKRLLEQAQEKIDLYEEALAEPSLLQANSVVKVVFNTRRLIQYRDFEDPSKEARNRSIIQGEIDRLVGEKAKVEKRIQGIGKPGSSANLELGWRMNEDFWVRFKKPLAESIQKIFENYANRVPNVVNGICKELDVDRTPKIVLTKAKTNSFYVNKHQVGVVIRDMTDLQVVLKYMRGA